MWPRIYDQAMVNADQVESINSKILQFQSFLILGHAKIVQYLFDQKADICRQSNLGLTPFWVSIEFGNFYENIEWNSWCSEWTYFNFIKGHENVIDIFLQRYADINCTEDDNWKPLYYAISLSKFKYSKSENLLLNLS